jgi:hypothetical protein
MGFIIRKFLIEYSCRYQVGKIITMVNRLGFLSNLGPNYVMIPKVSLNTIIRMRSIELLPCINPTTSFVKFIHKCDGLILARPPYVA